MDYICHSGGCAGADMMWETVGKEYGVLTISYSFPGHKHGGSYPYIMNEDELAEGWDAAKRADQTLKRNLKDLSEFGMRHEYVKKLLERNWFQVKNSEAIYAVGMFEKSWKTVKGGTGWAVQMALDNYKPVYLYDQTSRLWWMYTYADSKFDRMYTIPRLTKNFAGIGTRGLNNAGAEAIKEILKYNFE